jgi:ABC-2 type transport system ATP-binding protein
VAERLAVEVRDLEKRYEPAGVQALAGVSFDVEEGEIFGYLGRNGAGKSTTVRILTTLLRPTAGRAVVGGFDVGSDPASVRQAIGVAMQEAALDELMTGREHLLLAARLAGLGKAAARDRAEELLEVFGLRAPADRVAARYSGGMRRRLDIAMAVVRRPDVLFLDEPTTGLDPQGRRALWALVGELRAQGSTVFLTTQNLAEADALADRVAIVHDGRIAAIGRPEDLKARFGGATTIRVRADEANAARVREAAPGQVHSEGRDGWLTLTVEGGEAEVPSIVARMGAAGASVEHLSIHSPSLEDVFVNLTGSEIERSGDSGDAGSVAAARRGMGVAPGGRR